MENRIPIDDIFHEKLSLGREQINLGAWANMERMLDGKNPYAVEDKKKRRGFLPFFLLLLITTGIAGLGYYLNHQPSNHTDLSKLALSTPSTKKSTQHPDIETSSTEELVSRNQSNLNSSSISNNNTPSEELIAPAQHGHGSQVKKNQGPSSVNKDYAIDNSSHQGEVSGQVSEQPGKKRKIKRSGNTQDEHLSASANPIQHQGDEVNSLNENHQIDAQVATLSEEQKNQHKELPTSTKKTKLVKEKIPMVTINQKTLRNRDGSVRNIIDDTIAKSDFEKITETVVDDNRTASLDPMISNPRFKKLNEVDEINANLRVAEEPRKEPVVASASTPEISNTQSDLLLNHEQKTSIAKKTGYFDDLKLFFMNAYNKVNNYMLFSPKPDVYTGLNLGMNASLSNAKRNFGGFQGGFVMLRPINDYLSFITECKFFYRNNGGYTVSDISYNISDTTRDNISMAHNTIYSYQKDSSVKTYNFKSFYSIEMPLMVQLNYRAFGIYGGVNIAYNFKLKTTEKSKQYAPIYTDTVANGMAYSFPIDKPSIIRKDDFSSRFGLGYTVGASYNFSPQLYLDLRITQNVWDNKTTNAAREISNGFFKVPSIQFALGYRFRKFTPDN